MQHSWVCFLLFLRRNVFSICWKYNQLKHYDRVTILNYFTQQLDWICWHVGLRNWVKYPKPRSKPRDSLMHSCFHLACTSFTESQFWNAFYMASAYFITVSSFVGHSSNVVRSDKQCRWAYKNFCGQWFSWYLQCHLIIKIEDREYFWGIWWTFCLQYYVRATTDKC